MVVLSFTARPLPLPSGLRIKSAMTGTTRRFRIKSAMTGTTRGLQIRSRMTGWGGEKGLCRLGPSHGFVVLSGSVQSMKFGYVHRREYGACWFFVFIQLPLFPPRAPGFAARGTSRHRKSRGVANSPSGINASIRSSLSPLPRRTRPFGTSECGTCLCAAFPCFYSTARVCGLSHVTLSADAC